MAVNGNSTRNIVLLSFIFFSVVSELTGGERGPDLTLTLTLTPTTVPQLDHAVTLSADLNNCTPADCYPSLQIILSQGTIIIHDSGWVLLSRYSLL